MGCSATKRSQSNSSSIRINSPQQNKTDIEEKQLTLATTESILQDISIKHFDQKITTRSSIKKGVMKSNSQERVLRIMQLGSLSIIEKDNLTQAVHQIMKLNHINIANLIQYYNNDGTLYLVQDYFCGGNLLLSLEKLAMKTQIELYEIFLQIIAGIQYLHHNGITHGDIRLEHIVFENKSFNNIKIIDFGISHQIKRVSMQWNPKKTAQETYCRAPETFKGKATLKSDIWSCGCLLYFFLSQTMPFYGKDLYATKLSIMRGIVDFDNPAWQAIDDKVKNLISKMLSPNPELRPSTQEILNQSFLRDVTKCNQKPNKAVLKNMADFKAVSEIQAATLIYIADNLMSEIDKRKLMREFAKYDINNDGFLTKEELLQVYKKTLPEEEALEQIDQLFEKIDQNNSGKIDYKEFVLASIDQKKYFNKERLGILFHQIDRDHSGHLSKLEMIKLLREMQIPQEKMNDIIQQLDQNGDGEVNEQEFIQMMLKLH